MEGPHHELERVLSVLEEQAAVCREMEAALLGEKKALVSADTEALDRLEQEKGRAAARLGFLERRCREIVERTLPDPPPKGEATLGRLAEMLPTADAERLRRCRDRLTERVQALVRLQEENRTLVAHALALVREASDLLERLMFPRNVYTRRGRADEAPRTGRLLTGAV
jgi:flagellar biosynthesis/type III secretory pathway chaperone